MKGRKAELKAIDGGLAGVPAMPDEIPADMASEWQTIAADMAQRKILTPSMSGVLSTYILALWTVRECREAIAKHGLLVETAHKMMKPNPASGMMAKAMDTVSRLAAELGLTPAARSKQGFQPKEAANEGAPSNLDL